MKRLFTTLVLALAALAAFAQNETDEQTKQKFFDVKVRVMASELRLTEQQQADFTPVYQKYSDEMHAAIGHLEKPAGRPEKTEEAPSDEDVAKWVKTRLENQQKGLSIRLKYVDEFAKVLEPRQLRRLYDVEDQIQKALRDRKGHGPRPDGEPGGQRGQRGPKPNGPFGPRGEN